MSDKARTNRRWTSTEEHRAGWDRIFGKLEKEDTTCQRCGGTGRIEVLPDGSTNFPVEVCPTCNVTVIKE